MKKILVLDPGEHTGWCFQDESGKLYGGTIEKIHEKVAQLIEKLKPDIVVFERFNLYPQKAQSLAWNSFYPCEVIGVIRFLCERYQIAYVEQAPGIKKFFGGFQSDWSYLKINSVNDNITEHTKDAYQHYRYFLCNKAKLFGAVDPLKISNS